MSDVILPSKKKIVFTGGGTAGHVYPALAVEEKIKKDYIIHYIGGQGMEKEIVSKEKEITYHQIDAVKLERKLTLQNLAIPFKLIKSVFESKKILKEVDPSIVFSKGGYVALPVVISARMLKIPIVSHESDLSLGLANKIILKFCNVMCTSFEQTANGDKFVYTGQPIRSKILNGNKKNLSLPNFDDKPNLLVVGGSSGASFLNENVIKYLDKLLAKFNIIHLTGKGKNNQKINKKGYVQIEYADNMGDYLDWADLVLSRAGSGAINEFLAMQKPMLLIPLSKNCSRGDQIENAKLFENLGYCQMIEEENFNEKILFEKLDNLVKNNEKYLKNIKKSGKNNACDRIIEILHKYER